MTLVNETQISKKLKILRKKNKKIVLCHGVFDFASGCYGNSVVYSFARRCQCVCDCAVFGIDGEYHDGVACGVSFADREMDDYAASR